jgi:antitoxin component YwqK of YwqJK toxin-antitoxin module
MNSYLSNYFLLFTLFIYSCSNQELSTKTIDTNKLNSEVKNMSNDSAKSKVNEIKKSPKENSSENPYYFLKSGIKTGTTESSSTLYKEYYPSKAIKFIVHLKNDLLDGECFWYWENGKLQQRSNWNEGVENGLIEFYYENGNKEQYFKRENGLIEGEVISYHEIGGVRSKGICIKGKKEGTWKYFDIKGKLIEKRTYKEDTCIDSLLVK